MFFGYISLSWVPKQKIIFMTLFSVETIGSLAFVATIGLSLANLDQVRRNWIGQSGSIVFAWSGLIVMILWTIYGSLLGLWKIWFCNGFGALIALLVVIAYYKGRKRKSWRFSQLFYVYCVNVVCNCSSSFWIFSFACCVYCAWKCSVL